MTRPLAVDLDGTLCATDTFHEGLCRLALIRPTALLAIPGWWRRGRARVKAGMAAITGCDAAHLPYRPEVLDWLRAERATGRELWLVTGADRRTARAVVAHLGIFTGIIASDGRINRVAEAKRTALVQRFGEHRFAYAGDSGQDYAPWAAASEVIVVGSRDPGVPLHRRFPVSTASLGEWAMVLRAPGWIAGGMLAALLLAVQASGLLTVWGDERSVRLFLPAGVALGLGATGIRILDDLLALGADRRDELRRMRPLPAGRIRLSRVMALSALLLAAAMVVGCVATPVVGGLVAFQCAGTGLRAWLRQPRP